MIRPIKVILVAGLIASTLTGVTYAATRAVPDDAKVTIQNTTAAELPGDRAALDAALTAPSPVKYKVLVIDAVDGEDKTTYLDRVAENWGQPAADTLLLVVFTQDNYDIRFYMGANFRARDVSGAEMLGLVRGQYFAKVRKADPAGGLADLIVAVNKRLSAAPADTVKPVVDSPLPTQPGDYVAADPFSGPRRTAVQEVNLAKDLLTHHLSRFKATGMAEQFRLTDFRFSDNDLNFMQEGEKFDVYMVKFDVLPVSQNHSWMGRLIPGDVAWVGTTLFMKVVKVDGGWKIDSFSTSP
jgi:hypothetical protein